MNESSDFYTLKGYQKMTAGELTPTMEDYLEMVYRLLLTSPVVRIGELSSNLNVKPSSATKIVQLLKEKGLLLYEQYGYIQLTKEGLETGKYLYSRHNILHDFFCTVNHSKYELELVEMVEHFINKGTVKNLASLTEYLKEQGY